VSLRRHVDLLSCSLDHLLPWTCAGRYL
jgi:hypothetical protein